MNKITLWKINDSLTKMSEWSFPEYRKYSNDSSYFRIHSETYFEEIKKMPGGLRHYVFKARILPDRNYIADMLHCAGQSWVIIEASEYEEKDQEVNSSSASR